MEVTRREDGSVQRRRSRQLREEVGEKRGRRKEGGDWEEMGKKKVCIEKKPRLLYRQPESSCTTIYPCVQYSTLIS